MKVFIAVATYGGIKCKAFAESLEKTVLLLTERGYEFDFAAWNGDCYVQNARNELVARFLTTDCDRLVFLDDDVSWGPEDFIRLIETPGFVVAGIYPKKDDKHGWPVVTYNDANNRALTRSDGCIAASHIPLGFACIRREAIEKLCASYPDQKYGVIDDAGIQTGEMYDLFPQGVKNGRWWGEDFAFSRLWTDIGGQIWVVPNMTFTHWQGDKAFTGNYHEFLLRQPGGSEV